MLKNEAKSNLSLYTERDVEMTRQPDNWRNEEQLQQRGSRKTFTEELNEGEVRKENKIETLKQNIRINDIPYY